MYPMSGMRPKPADLFVAISSENVEFVQKVLDQGAEVNCVMRQVTPLHFAIRHRTVDIMRLLISKGADVNARGGLGRQFVEPPIVTACRMNMTYIAKVLLECKKLNVDQVDFFGYSALYYAVDWGNAELVCRLLDHGANINMSTSYDNHPLHLAAVRQRSRKGREMAQLLIQRGCTVDNFLLTELVMIENFETFRFAVWAGCVTHNGLCTPTHSMYRKWMKDSQKFSEWMQENKSCMEINPRSLRSIAISAIRRILVENCKNIRMECLDQLCIPSRLKDQILLKE